MSNISQFFAGTRKKNRRIIHGGVGVTTITWRVPPGVTEVEAHCWGAGGNAAAAPNAGGGGGGYVTHVFPVSPTDSLSITVGAAPGGTSSISVPTQSPTSPISATGGSSGIGTGPGGAGGTGSYTIAPGISTARTFSASGGAGGPASPASGGGGGAAGSPLGIGGSGGTGPGGAGGGGGIGGAGGSGGGGGSLGGATFNSGGLGINGYKTVIPVGISSTIGYVTENMSGGNGDTWFYVDEILGAGGSPNSINGGAGGGGAWPGGNGGILGGGASAPFSGGRGGLAGGGGAGAPGPGPGGGGLVILYW